MAFTRFADRPLHEMLSLSGRTAVVTGAASGIGAACAVRLAEAGARLLLADRDAGGLDKTLAMLTGAGHSSAEVDVRDPGSVDALAATAVDRLGQLDVWVNDAGIQPMQAGELLTDAEFADVVHTNLFGVWYGSRAAYTRMRTTGGGVIINIASSVGFHGVKEQPHYAASKWGVRGLCTALAMDWGPENIRVVGIAPGLTDTPGVQAKLDRLDQIAGGDAFAAVSKAYPAGRPGEPDDIARAVVFAACDAATFITGSTLLVDGGEVAAGGS